MTIPTNQAHNSNFEAEIARQLSELKHKVEEINRSPEKSPKLAQFVPSSPIAKDRKTPKAQRKFHTTKCFSEKKSEKIKQMAITYIINGEKVELEKELENLRAYRADLQRQLESDKTPVNTPRDTDNIN